MFPIFLICNLITPQNYFKCKILLFRRVEIAEEVYHLTKNYAKFIYHYLAIMIAVQHQKFPQQIKIFRILQTRILSSFLQTHKPAVFPYSAIQRKIFSYIGGDRKRRI